MHYGSVPGRAKPRLASLVVISRSLLRVAASLTCCPASDWGLSISDICPPRARGLAGPSTYRPTFRRLLSERDSCYLPIFPSTLGFAVRVCLYPTFDTAYCSVTNEDDDVLVVKHPVCVQREYVDTGPVILLAHRRHGLAFNSSTF